MFWRFGCFFIEEINNTFPVFLVSECQVHRFKLPFDIVACGWTNFPHCASRPWFHGWYYNMAMRLKLGGDDKRLTEAMRWLGTMLDGEVKLRQIAGDASFRRFFRVCVSDKTFVLVDAPPDKNENEAFVKYNQLFKKINTPDFYSVNLDGGFFLEEDFGEESLFIRVKKKVDMAIYKKAIDNLVDFQKLSRSGMLPVCSREILELEMNRFIEWYREKYLRKFFNEKERWLWQNLIGRVVERILKQRNVYVHRDYHSKNIMVLSNGELGIIDYQDALFGPVTYDLVSLLKDAYLRLTPEQADELLNYYLKRSGLKIEKREFVKDFDYVGLQRHVKILGTFARLSLRDDKHGYLKDIPLVREYILEVVKKYEELAPLERLIS